MILIKVNFYEVWDNQKFKSSQLYKKQTSFQKYSLTLREKRERKSGFFLKGSFCCKKMLPIWYGGRIVVNTKLYSHKKRRSCY